LTVMKDQRSIVVLILICVGLIAALIWNQQRFSKQKAKDDQSIGNYSNKLVETSAILDQQRQVNTSLEDDLERRRDAFNLLTNAFTQVSGDLNKTETALKETRGEVLERDAMIANLESANQVLDQRAVDLGNSITNFTVQIEDTKNKLAVSESDKAFLEKELQRLMAAKAELERQFNDLAVLRAQVSKVKKQLGDARRLEWIRTGLFARQEQKGGQQLMDKPEFTNRPKPEYDLAVEINADGIVKIIPPLTDNPTATDPAAAE
jgi:chromosome segregation ATPase